MNEARRKKKMDRAFSITNFLFVTGVCFLLFTGAMRVLDGVTIKILLKIGLACLGLGIVALFFKWLGRNPNNSEEA